MEILLVGVYAFLVWLLVKFKLLPWNIATQVIVVLIPIVGLTILILTLNVVARTLFATDLQDEVNESE